MDLGLAGVKVLVTAASQGLGAATARRFSQEGAHVVVNSRTAGKLAQTAEAISTESGNPVYALAADVTDNDATVQMVHQAAEKLDGLDVIVTNAGGPPAGVFDDFSQDAWEDAVQLNLLSAVNLIRAALPYLRESDRAAILTITSIAAKEPQGNLTLSNAVRPAVLGLTKTLSLELATEGIRVNSILPGITDTERIVKLVSARAEKNNTSEQEERERMGGAIPLGRIGKPEEFANVAVFLCSPAAGFITGAMVPVDGGAGHTII